MRTINQLVKDLDKLRAKLEKTRDELTELCSEVGTMEDCANDALENVGYAIDRLSEQV